MQDLYQILGAIFFSRLFGLHIIGAFATFFLVITPIDHTLAVTALTFPANFVWIAVHTGYPASTFIPFVGIPLLFILAYIRKSAKLLRAGYAMSVAVFMAVLIQSAYKVLTGRSSPTCNDLIGAMPVCLEDARYALESFNFGFLENGIFWGWPSGHTLLAAAVGILFFLIVKGPLRFLGIICPIYVALAVSVHGHWFSDAVAGLCIGISVAYAVYHVIYLKKTKRASPSAWT